MDQPRQIRSYRVVFSLERRLHKIDRFRIPLPYGLPLRSVGYFVAVFVVLLAAARLPVLGYFLHGVPVPVRFLVLPGAGAVLLTGVRIDGRSAGAAGVAAAGYLTAPRQVAAGRSSRWGHVVRLDDLSIAPGAEGPVLRRGTLRGPCTVFLQSDARVRQRGHRTVVSADSAESWGSTPVDLGRRDRLVVR